MNKDLSEKAKKRFNFNMVKVNLPIPKLILGEKMK